MPKKKPSVIFSLILWPIKIFFFVLRLVLLAGFILFGWFLLQMFGVLAVQVPISGASMLPTLPEEGTVSFQRYLYNPTVQRVLPQSIQKGDIIVFENEETHKKLAEQKKDATGFVKRVIGTHGDKVEIRDGFVTVNGIKIDEPYILKPRSTFGGTMVQDCQEVRVPENKVFVLGDNRKVSMDSRQIGLVSISDVQYYIPFEKQISRFGKRWRDTTQDFTTGNSSLFDVGQFLKLLNQARKKQNLPALTYEPLLEQSAKLRARVMLEYDEFDPKAPKSGYNMEDAMADVGYSNIVFGEFPLIGYYDAQELFDALIEQPRAKEFLFNGDYQDIGISTFVGELNSCPVQVVVQHLAGYIPPNYGSAEITNWKNGLNRLKGIQSGWQKLAEYDEYYDAHKSDVDRINEIIALRIQRLEAIVAKLEANEWMSKEEKAWAEQDRVLSKEQNDIAERLNTKN